MAPLYNCITIPESGDATGERDSRRIQQTIDGLSSSTESFSEGCVQLSGVYYINKPIVNGTHDTPPVSLVGLGHALINYVGPATSDYALRCAGRKSEVASAGVQNIAVDCNGKCRGILASTYTYMANLRNLYVRHSVEVGLDAIDCWAAAIANVHVFGCAGYGMRFYRCNSATIDLLRVQGSAGDPPRWPSVGDTFAVDCTNTPYRASRQCGILFDQCSATAVRSLIAEAANYGPLPVVVIKGKCCLIERCHFEANNVGNCFCEIEGSSGWGRCNAIRGVAMSGSVRPECFVRFTRSTADNIIEQCPSSNLFRKAVAIQVGSSHSGNVVAMSRGTNPDVPDILTDTVV